MMTRMYRYIFMRNVAKNMKPLWKVVQIVRYIWGFGGERQIKPFGG